MSVRSPFRDRFRSAPVRTAMVSLVPVVLAVGQLANSLVNDLSPFLAVAFAAVMLCFAVVATGYQAAQHRVASLEAEW